MFRFECFVDDRKLADALRALAGIATQVSAPTPVMNATAKGGAVKAANGGTTLCEMFIEHIRKAETTLVTSVFIRDWLRASGRAPNSAPYILKCILKAGAVRKHPTKKGVYMTVLPRKKKGA